MSETYSSAYYKRLVATEKSLFAIAELLKADRYYFHSEEMDDIITPSHWMPLHSPPKT